MKQLILRGGEGKPTLPPSDGTMCPNCGFAFNQHDAKGNCPERLMSAMLMAERIMARYKLNASQMKMNLDIACITALMSKYRMVPVGSERRLVAPIDQL